MKTTSFKIKRHFITSLFFSTTFMVISLGACQKGATPMVTKVNPSSYSSEVLDKWMTLQLRLIRNATGIANHAFSRYFAYSGVTAIEALRPGLHGQFSQWTNKWNGLSGLPTPDHS